MPVQTSTVIQIINVLRTGYAHKLLAETQLKIDQVLRVYSPRWIAE